ncbi:MAG: sugar phosphate nucleotidyltransferase [Candidatus Magasanikbacteria bacterium]|jgi:glucose-1-phosphate cytidylyltransferase
MKTIILCGGTGTRMKEETEFKPKPLVEIGGKPMLWHIMKIYSHYGYNEFVLALGYKGNMIKEYFLNWRGLLNDFTLSTKTNEVTFHNNECDDFKITFAETGQASLTGERVLQAAKYLDDGPFMVTYGDGVSDINIKELVEFHNRQGTVGTITGIHPSTRFGMLNIHHESSKVVDFFQHKITDNEDCRPKDYINGGFMVFEKQVLDLITPNSMIESVFSPLSQQLQLSVYKHSGNWKCMDTAKEADDLNEMWNKDPFWKIWK